MTAEEYFYNHWQKANRSRFGDYGDYDSDEYAIAFANDYAASRQPQTSGSFPMPEVCENCEDVEFCSKECYCLKDCRQ